MRKSRVILFAILSGIMLFAIACSSDEANPNATATTAPPNTVPAVERTAEPTAAPTSTSAPVSTSEPGGTVMLDIDVNGDALQFNLGSMSAQAGADVVVTFNNSSSANIHNWALVEAGTKDAVAADGLTAGQANNWLPVNDPRVIASTILIAPGENGQATFTAPAAGTYQFVCTFPGHATLMFGDFTVN